MSLVLGVDPGFASFGLAVVDAAADRVLRLDVIRTEKSSRKRDVRASDDNLRRAREIVASLVKVIRSYDAARVMGCGHYGGTSFVAICAESMSFPRNASSAAKVAVSWGVIAALAEHFHLAIVQASPQEIKKTLCGRKDASKEDVEEAVRDRYGRFEVQLRELGVPKSLHNHAWDALSAYVACRESEVIRLAARFE